MGRVLRPADVELLLSRGVQVDVIRSYFLILIFSPFLIILMLTMPVQVEHDVLGIADKEGVNINIPDGYHALITCRSILNCQPVALFYH